MDRKATATATPPAATPRVISWSTPPWTLDERLQRIEALSQRVNGYVQFICQVGSLAGSSNEVKDRAVKAFYDRMVTMESQLGSIQESLKLD